MEKWVEKGISPMKTIRELYEELQKDAAYELGTLLAADSLGKCSSKMLL